MKRNMTLSFIKIKKASVYMKREAKGKTAAAAAAAAIKFKSACCLSSMKPASNTTMEGMKKSSKIKLKRDATSTEAEEDVCFDFEQGSKRESKSISICTDHRPNELHQEAASSPPSSNDKGQYTNEHIISGSGGIGELSSPQQQHTDDVKVKLKRVADDTSPITVGISDQDISNGEVHEKATEEEQQQQEDIDFEPSAPRSPPHLRRRWQQHIDMHRDREANETPTGAGVFPPQCIKLFPKPKQQLTQPNKNCNCSIAFYNGSPTRARDLNLTSTSQFPSPTCVADVMDHFEGSSPGEGNDNAVSPSSSSFSTFTASDNNINFFILLLCPQSRIFEVVEISDAPIESSVGHVLTLIPQHVTDVRLLKKKYIGLCRPADRTEFIDLTLPAFFKKNASPCEDCTPFDFIHKNDVLVAILNGSTCYQMSKISKPILRNPKFKEMIRRRRRQSAADRAARKKRKSKKNLADTLQSPTKAIQIPDDCSDISGITCTKAAHLDRNQAQRGEDSTSLRRMLETLSKKLHEVEVEDDGAGFKMSPKMLAMELVQTIEDIFVNRNVEIVAVDADADADDNDENDKNIDDNEGDDDDDTFVSARSHRTKSTVGTLKSIKSPSQTLPRNAATSNHRTKPSRRRFKYTNTIEGNALAAQIEAMAAQADAVFEARRRERMQNLKPRSR